MEAADPAEEVCAPDGHGHSLAQGSDMKGDLVETKASVMAAVCRELGLDSMELGVGSSIPREFFSRVAERLGLSDEGSATDVARRVAMAGQVPWPEAATSEASPSGGGGTVTLEGLTLVKLAVEKCIRADRVEPESLPVTVPAVRGEWTLIEGQTSTRGILHRRYGVEPGTQFDVSPWTDDIFLFFDPSGSSVIATATDDLGTVAIHLALKSWQSLALLQDVLAARNDQVSGIRPVRLFEGVEGATKYVGEFELAPGEPQWTSEPAVVLQLVRRGVTRGAARLTTSSDDGESLPGQIAFSPYNEADASLSRQDGPIPFEVDPDLLDRALREHSQVQNATATWLTSAGLIPLSPSSESPAFDIAWSVGRELFVGEVKTVNDINEQRQFRLGLGQVLDYAQELSARPVLILSARPQNDRLLAVAGRAGVIVVWPELFRDLDPSLV
jgi:hypothetical protein